MNSASPFRRMGPEPSRLPVLISVPHAGRAYSAALLGAARLSRARLEVLEDRLVDRLVWRAVAAGAGAIIADAPRAEIDLNRDEREIDPAMVVPRLHPSRVVESVRSRGGLGLVPGRIAGAGPIWRERLPAAELDRRIAEIHRPYHSAIEAELVALRDRFGIAILLDCHSMPPRSAAGEAQIILGDRHGGSIAAEYVEAAEHAVWRAGYSVARNAPYAGGHLTARNGRPRSGIHALQLEIDRSLYLAEDLRHPGPDFDRIATMIGEVVEAIAARALEPPQAVAAE
ncbi:MAG: N-formylglutamate amidohydrolase [Alphaproteobacteria bacterium]|nr:N-formylglutamate amidohydrolase [Alphaproteobacteria bacterium]